MQILKLMYTKSMLQEIKTLQKHKQGRNGTQGHRRKTGRGTLVGGDQSRRRRSWSVRSCDDVVGDDIDSAFWSGRKRGHSGLLALVVGARSDGDDLGGGRNSRSRSRRDRRSRSWSRRDSRSRSWSWSRRNGWSWRRRRLDLTGKRTEGGVHALNAVDGGSQRSDTSGDWSLGALVVGARGDGDDSGSGLSDGGSRLGLFGGGRGRRGSRGLSLGFGLGCLGPSCLGSLSFSRLGSRQWAVGGVDGLDTVNSGSDSGDAGGDDSGRTLVVGARGDGDNGAVDVGCGGHFGDFRVRGRGGSGRSGRSSSRSSSRSRSSRRVGCGRSSSIGSGTGVVVDGRYWHRRDVCGQNAVNSGRHSGQDIDVGGGIAHIVGTGCSDRGDGLLVRDNVCFVDNSVAFAGGSSQGRWRNRSSGILDHSGAQGVIAVTRETGGRKKRGGVCGEVGCNRGCKSKTRNGQSERLHYFFFLDGLWR
ncbi:predicted protein [Clavispora lusitaniae ATCC 42720]|uniref:Uncharacterized protein n=1 Tax=Clavispora lusitaniae (strain ATCC 42720) TaxID=306902 RepID=C4YA57_CLAL4|nr:uncharacterized protein CLUG_04995 [Clavispora lusitaniae ATCC 42720]EEQ40867.1 predicted protein [Clavispora lusitaniae ATCC 42720]